MVNQSEDPARKKMYIDGVMAIAGGTLCFLGASCGRSNEPGKNNVCRSAWPGYAELRIAGETTEGSRRVGKMLASTKSARYQSPSNRTEAHLRGRLRTDARPATTVFKAAACRSQSIVYQLGSAWSVHRKPNRSTAQPNSSRSISAKECQ
jgi:hypothetical protein